MQSADDFATLRERSIGHNRIFSGPRNPQGAGSARTPRNAVDCDVDIEAIARRFPSQFAGILKSERTRSILAANAVVRELGDGSVLYRDGDECSHLPLVLTGEVALTKHGESGRAITLYRVGDGESCILSTLSIMNQSAFPAMASTHGLTSLLLVPAGVVRQLVETDGAWRSFVFSMYHQRLSGLIELVEEVAFGKLDIRLAEFVLSQVTGEHRTLSMTHQEIAMELGSSREVVSRMLKEWEKRGFVSMRRGAVTVEAARPLEKLIAERD